jgi:uncharacterized protein YjbJ (UPF0337 family)
MPNRKQENIMNRDRIQGASRHLKGRAQTALGGITGDPARQVRGAVNQVAGGAQYAYGRARQRAEDLADDGRHLAYETRRRGATYGRQALRYADGHRANTVLGIAALAFAAGWLVRRAR